MGARFWRRRRVRRFEDASGISAWRRVRKATKCSDAIAIWEGFENESGSPAGEMLAKDRLLVDCLRGFHCSRRTIPEGKAKANKALIALADPGGNRTPDQTLRRTPAVDTLRWGKSRSAYGLGPEAAPPERNRSVEAMKCCASFLRVGDRPIAAL